MYDIVSEEEGMFDEKAIEVGDQGENEGNEDGREDTLRSLDKKKVKLTEEDMKLQE